MPNFEGITLTRGRKYDPTILAALNDSLTYLPITQRAAVLASILEESQGNASAVSANGTYQGLLQWGANRYKIKGSGDKELSNQLQYLKNTINNPSDHISWTDGGKGSGYKSYKDAYNDFHNSNSSLEKVLRGFSFGYVRPKGKEDSFQNRLKVAEQVYERLLQANFPTPNINLIHQPDATRVAKPVVPVQIHRKDYGGYILPEVEVVAKYPYEQRVIDTMNASNAEFMQRLRNNDFRAIHNADGSYSTHVLGNADNLVFPAIQDVNGVLEDYRNLPWQRTLDKAIQNKDYIEFPTEGDARYFGEHYKKYFPEFFSNFGDNQYAEGGPLGVKTTPRRATIRRRSWESDEEYQERLKDLGLSSQEEIDAYNNEVNKENTQKIKEDNAHNSAVLAKARANGTLSLGPVERFSAEVRKVHDSAKKAKGFNKLRELSDSVSQGVDNQKVTAKNFADSVQQYSNEQAEKRQQEMADIKKGFDATAGALELMTAGYTVGHLAIPRLVNTNTGFLGGVSNFFNNNGIQLGMNSLGALADGYQLLTADNKFDTWENGIELGGDTAGIIGGLDVVRNTGLFGRYSNAIDTTLDGIGMSAASWDILKKIPPFKYFYGKLKDNVNGTHETEDDQYAEGGDLDSPKQWDDLPLSEKSDIMVAAIRNGVTTLEEIRKAWNDFADDSHRFLKGGYKPSQSIKNRIANWEGSSMKTNRSFDAEARDFWAKLPSNVRNNITQEEADALYSYSYNVGAGNFAKRVVPALERLYSGKGSVSNVQKSMWASLDDDPHYPGLAKRRATERRLFGNAFGSADHNIKATMGSFLENIPQEETSIPEGYTPVIENPYYTRPVERPMAARQEPVPQEPYEPTAMDRLNHFQKVMSMMGMGNEAGYLNPLSIYSKDTDNGYLSAWGNTFAEGGNKDGVTSSNGFYHVAPEDYEDVLDTVEGNEPVDVILPELTVKAANPKNYRSSYHPEDAITFMNLMTAGLLNRGSITQDIRLLSDAYQAIKGEKSWYDVANSAILGNEGIFESPWANMALDVAVPVGSAGVYKLTPLKNTAKEAAKNIAQETNKLADKVWHSTWAQYPRYYVGKLYYGMDAELPTIYRKLRNIPQVTNGKMQISPIHNRFAYINGEDSPLITNMTTDVPVRPHSSDWEDADVLAFAGKNLLGKHVISTRPSDTFTFGDVLTIDPQKVTYISGRPRALKIAKERGMNTLTSEQAKDIARSHVFGNNSNYRDYGLAIQDLTRNNFKSPTLKDYKFMDWVFQPKYKSKVVSFQDLSNPSVEQLSSSPEWLRGVFGNQLYRMYLSNPKEWRNVLYHPASSVEDQFRKIMGIELKDEIPNYYKK